jgi:hypothetical protein
MLHTYLSPKTPIENTQQKKKRAAKSSEREIYIHKGLPEGATGYPSHACTYPHELV